MRSAPAWRDDIARASAGWLTARSLRDPAVQTLLDAAQPDWRWEPTLLEVRDGRPRIFTGVAMRARMALGLGPRRAWRVLESVRQADMTLANEKLFTSKRRTFLQRTGVIAGLLFMPRLDKNQQSLLQSQSGTGLRVLSADEIAPLMTLITSSQSYRNFLAQLGKSAVPNQPFALEHGSTLYVTIPLTVGNQSEMGFFSAALQTTSTGTASMREAVALYRQDIPQGRKISLWLNTQLISEAIFDDQGTIVDGWIIKDQRRVDVTGQNLVAQGRSQADAILQQFMDASTGQSDGTARTSSSSCYSDCSNRCSVPNDIAGAAALLCGAACLYTAGAGCLICATLAAGLYAYNVACCLYKCNAAPALPCCGA